MPSGVGYSAIRRFTSATTSPSATPSPSDDFTLMTRWRFSRSIIGAANSSTTLPTSLSFTGRPCAL